MLIAVPPSSITNAPLARFKEAPIRTQFVLKVMDCEADDYVMVCPFLFPSVIVSHCFRVKKVTIYLSELLLPPAEPLYNASVTGSLKQNFRSLMDNVVSCLQINRFLALR